MLFGFRGTKTHKWKPISAGRKLHRSYKEEFSLMKIFENLFELSKGALPVCLVPSKKPTTKFLTLNSCWKVYVTFQYFAHFLSEINNKIIWFSKSFITLAEVAVAQGLKSALSGQRLPRLASPWIHTAHYEDWAVFSSCGRLTTRLPWRAPRLKRMWWTNVWRRLTRFLRTYSIGD